MSSGSLSLMEFLSVLRGKYAALDRAPTLEEMGADLIAFIESRPTPTKRQLRAEKIKQLQRYIDIANKLPPDRHARDIGLFLGDPRAPEQSPIEFEIKRFRALLHYLEEPKTPPDFRGYILEGVSESALNFARSGSMYVPDPGRFADWKSLPAHLQDEIRNPLPEIYLALQKYDEFREARDKLRTIARISKERPAFGPATIRTYSYLYRDSQGVLQQQSDLFAETVRGLETNRIRECPICQRIFWADRSDKSCCSKPCASVFNTRRSRGQLSENRKYKRRKSKRTN